MNLSSSTSWENVSQWYSGIVSEKGHYYHKDVILPKLIQHLKTKKNNQSLLDLGCGNGIVLNILPSNFSYHGIDISPSLVNDAKKINRKASFSVLDICQPFDLKKQDFSHALMMLSFQNLQDPQTALINAKKHLKQGGQLFLVINHPCFRVPRQSSWGVDPQQKIQYRKVQKYMSHMQIPIIMQPSKKNSPITYSYHHSLSDISAMLLSAGFVIHQIQEWTSNKVSQGHFAKQENIARDEIPLFMFISAKSL